jgi:HEAT repeat protein
VTRLAGKGEQEDEVSITIKSYSFHAIGYVLHILVCSALLGGTACGQAQQSPPEKLAYGADMANVPDAIAKIKSGEFGGVHVDLVTRAGAVEAIPALQEQFRHVGDPLLKAKIAAALVRLGDKDDSYWNYLVKLATPALESDAPDFTNHDERGKTLPGPSPQFEAWVKNHNLPTDGLAENTLYVFPGEVAFLGWSRDPRAVPFLRQALLSPNYQIEIAGALGLAEIGQKDSIPFIINACKKAPAEVAATIAESLVYFDDPEAQSAVDQYIPKDTAKIYRDAKSRGKKTPWTIY